MSAVRPFALVRTRDQWLRCSHEHTTLDAHGELLELDWTEPPPLGASGETSGAGAGLAFDSGCRLFHSVPEEGRVERILYAAMTAEGTFPESLDWIVSDAPTVEGDFAPAETATGRALTTPRGMAVDPNDRLFIADAGARRVLVFDLWSRRLLRRAVLAVEASPSDASGFTSCAPFASRMPLPDVQVAAPLDIAAANGTVLVVTRHPGALFRLTARGEVSKAWETLWPLLERPSRIALSPAGVGAVLCDAGRATARVVPLDRAEDAFETPYATDLEFESEEVLVVARQPGADFLRFDMKPGRRGQALSPMRARGYDGRGIVLAPEGGGRIVYWTSRGPRIAIPARVEWQRRGRVVTFRLDSREYQTQWGRVFLDACIPDGTDVRVGFISRDEVEDDEPLFPRVRPVRQQDEVVFHEELSPPMPPQAEVDAVLLHSLHRREDGTELPWIRPAADDPFRTFEAPIFAPPGRYLWIALELTGNTKLTPRVRCVRAEYPSHDTLRRLPRTFSRDPKMADFLRRYLAPAEALLALMGERSAHRDELLRPNSAPAELLPWLASFVGLVMDQRWSEDVRRTFLEEAAELFRLRGTVRVLTRMIEIVTGLPPILIEHYQLRGLGGGLVDGAGEGTSEAVVGAGFRVGGQIGEPTEVTVSASEDDAFKTFAHRFTVMIPAPLSGEPLAMVRHLIEVHRPAHTLFDLCTVEAGMRIGRGLLAGVSTLIGPTGGFDTVQVGGSVLGRGTIVGRPESGGSVGLGQLGRDSRVG